MGHGKKGYVRAGDYVEVRVPKASSYSQLVNHALKVLDVERKKDRLGLVCFGLTGLWCQSVVSMTSHGLWQGI